MTKIKMDKKIVVGLSGGVDSSIALFLLKKQGWQPIGVSLKLPGFSQKSLETARKVCQKLDVPYFALEAEKEFKKKVIAYFLKKLREGQTPNPCVFCNPYLKFKKLFEWAKRQNIKYVATGHYARLKKNPETENYELFKAKDKTKDQTYFLSLLPRKWLKNIIFPLGNYFKNEIYQKAKEEGFGFLLKQRESQNLCFLAENSFKLKSFLKKELGKKPGLIKDSQGNILGKHQGLYFYTIGQRKNINLPGGPYFVLKKNKKENCLIVTKNKKDLMVKKIFVKNINWLLKKKPKLPLKAKVKIRYGHKAVSVIIYQLRNDYHLEFNKPQSAVTPGQFAVFYQKNICLGGGEIISVN